MASLRVTPEDLMNMGNQIASKAAELEQLCKSLDGKVETVANSTSGMASNAFYNSYASMQEAVHSFPQVVQAIASSAQGAAKVYDATDSGLAEAYGG